MPRDVRIIWIQRVVTSLPDESLGHFQEGNDLIKGTRHVLYNLVNTTRDAT